jgi:hypothetical protein
MLITEIHPPTNGGTLYQGFAENAHRRRYLWMAHPGKDTPCAFREETDKRTGLSWWHQIRAPRPLTIAVRKALSLYLH